MLSSKTAMGRTTVQMKASDDPNFGPLRLKSNAQTVGRGFWGYRAFAEIP
jgi:hypothetical protein